LRHIPFSERKRGSYGKDAKEGGFADENMRLLRLAV
jgi:hypothetical protein